VKRPTLRYRCPFVDGPPPIGCILMGKGPRVRRGYRILGAARAKSAIVGLGVVTWKLHVESMPSSRARAEIEAGAPYWTIVWDRRKRHQPDMA
jgi:hypothetical protein